MLVMWQDPPLPTELTIDEHDEQVLKKYGVWNPPVPFPPSNTPENIQAFYASAKRSPHLIETFGNLAFMIPELAFDEILLGLRSISGEGSPESQTMTAKVLSIDSSGATGELFPAFITFLAERETKYFAGAADTTWATPAVERGTAVVDMHELMIDQRKVMWDVLKKTYFSKYKFKADERLQYDAWYVNEWRGADFVTLPPFIAAYLYYRGLDKHFTIGGTYLHTVIEPGMRFMSGSDVTGAIMLEWKPDKEWPVGIIASVGMYSGKPDFEFIGIGTSIGEVKKAIRLNRP